METKMTAVVERTTGWPVWAETHVGFIKDGKMGVLPSRTRDIRAAALWVGGN